MPWLNTHVAPERPCLGFSEERGLPDAEEVDARYGTENRLDLSRRDQVSVPVV